MAAASPSISGIRTPGDFYAHALAIEREAAMRYLEFADQMLTHNNPEVARLFQDLATLESDHHAILLERCCRRTPPALKPWEYRWIDPESPEAAPLEAAHYLMTPWHAIRVALVNELRAQRLFEAVARSPEADADVRRLAAEFAAEEHEHAAHLEAMLVSIPAPDLTPLADLDPPVSVD